jgi:hypothetical protein
MTTPILDKVIEQLKALPYELQWRVLEFTRASALSTLMGSPASNSYVSRHNTAGRSGTNARSD